MTCIKKLFYQGSKSGDYHDDMNFQNFITWVNNQLLPIDQQRLYL
jgi:hypothetical protein